MPNHSTVITEFQVVDCSSAYNLVIGRPLLMALQAAVSIWHLTMKFPTSGGIGCTRGDQREARECYNASISKAHRGAENHMVADTRKERASKWILGEEGVVELYDFKESLASTIIHHHMEPSLGGDSAPLKAEI